MQTIERLERGDYEDILLWVDHREEEEVIVEAMAERLDRNDVLKCFWRNDNLFVEYNGNEHLLPLTTSPHDRYVAISSVAELIKDKYTVFIESSSIDSDTHGLLVISKSELHKLQNGPRQTLDANFTELELGKDYFGGIAVPYIGHLDNNPNFAEESVASREELDSLVSSAMNSPEVASAMQRMKEDISIAHSETVVKAIWKRRLISMLRLTLIVLLAIQIVRHAADLF